VGKLLPDVFCSVLFALSFCPARRIFSSSDKPSTAFVEAKTDFFSKLRRFKFFNMLYLSSISVVLFPMNVTSPFNPSAVLQPISIKTTEIKTVDKNILLIIF
jgi:hypothetical protein